MIMETHSESSACVTYIHISSEPPAVPQFSWTKQWLSGVVMTQDGAGRAFRDCMSMYTFDFFGADPAALSMQTQIADIADRGGVPATVYVRKRSGVAPDHVTLRVPVYYGAPLPGMYRDEALRALQGAGTAETLSGVDRSGAFCIAGPVPIVHGRFLGRSFIAVHGYGLNFESAQTRDHRHFNRAGGFAIGAAVAELRARVRLWVGAAARQSPSGVHLRVPPIGLGQFLIGVEDAGHRSAIAFELLVAFKEAAGRHGGAVVVVVCDFGDLFGGTFPRPPDSEHFVVRPWGNLFEPGGVEDAGQHAQSNAASRTASRTAEPLVVGGRALALLNAWDDCAFIGNGGARDKTVDGFFVAGWGPNEHFKNASYLQNPVFHPGMKDPRSWVEVAE